MDENGAPLVVFHGTNSENIEAFTPSRHGSFGSGVYMTAERGTASEYGDIVVDGYMSLQNPWAIQVDSESAGSFEEDFDSPAVEAILSLPGGRDLLNEARDGVGLFGGGLQSTLARMGHDGVIATYPDGSTEYVAFDPAQIKSVNNQGTFDASDPRILFQTDGPEQPLAVAHNISARGLEIADGMGGLAAPSLGVVRADIGPLDGFGEITLVGGPQMADPKQPGVRSFNADVYSVRQPRALTGITKKDKSTIEKKLDPAAEELGGRFYDLDTNDFERGGLRYLADQPEAALSFLRSKGIPFRVPLTKVPDVPAALKRVVSGRPFEVRQDPVMMAAITEHFQAKQDDLTARFPDRTRGLFLEEDGSPNINLFNRLVDDIDKAKSPRKPDYFAAREALRKK